MSLPKLLILSLALGFPCAVHAQSEGEDLPCVTDSLAFVTNSTDWCITNNSIGKPNKVNATVILYQYNAFGNFPDARWISCTSDWTQNTNMSNPDDSIAYRYQFNSVQKDSINFDFTVRRDNYCTVYVDNQVLLKDPVIWVYGYYDAGALIKKTIWLDTGRHVIDIVVYNRNSFNGINGFGLLAAGYITAEANVLIPHISQCVTYSCNDTGTIVRTDVQPDEKSVFVYPNPAKDDFVYIDIQGMDKNAGYTLCDMAGKVVLRSVYQPGKKNELDMSRLAGGMYLLKLDDSPGATRIVKQ